MPKCYRSYSLTHIIRYNNHMVWGHSTTTYVDPILPKFDPLPPPLLKIQTLAYFFHHYSRIFLQFFLQYLPFLLPFNISFLFFQQRMYLFKVIHHGSSITWSTITFNTPGEICSCNVRTECMI